MFENNKETRTKKDEMSAATLTRKENQELYEVLVKKYPGCPELWRYFLALTEVPRPSRHTARVSQWAQQIGTKLGGTARADAAGNVAITIPATPFVVASSIALEHTHTQRMITHCL